MNKKPLVTVITVCRNTEDSIEATIKSVLEQTYKNIEYIIIDGASTDRTLEIVNKYKNKISKIISEPDKGIYDAMNKGISLSKGDYLYFLNSGDKLINENVIQKIIFLLIKKPVDMIFGNVITTNKSKKDKSKNFPYKIEEKFFMKNSLCQQSMLISRALFNKVGPFDISYPILADRKWTLDFIKSRNFTYLHINKNICSYDLNGVSGKNKNKIKYAIENFRYITTNYSLIEYILYQIRKIFHFNEKN